jgi:type I restriction enzyme S subunit
MTVEMVSMPELPNGWASTGLGEIGEVNLGKTPRKTQYTNGGGLKIVKFRDIVGDSIYWDENDKGFVVDSESLIAQLCELHKGDVLVTASAHSSEHIGKKVVYVSTIPQSYSKVFFVGELLCVRVSEDGINPRIVYYYLSSQDGYRAVQHHVRGVHLIASEARQIPIPLPPLPEQHRIVAKIEELFTRLDAGVKALNRTKAQLKRYRQAVLKHAFEGKLTEEWRQAHKHELEPAFILLERIKEKRQETAKAKDLPSPDTNDLPELPEGWSYFTLDFLVPGVRNAIRRGPFGSAIKKAFFVPSGYKVYEQGNVIYNDFDRGSYYIDEKKFEEMKDFEVRPGDILMSCSGTVGKITIAPEGIRPGVINQALLKITLNNKIVDTSYFVYLFRSRVEEIMLANTRGSAMVNVSSVKDLRQIPFPISSVPEQHKIVEEIERHFSVADQIEKNVDHSLKKAERLRQSILKRAFEGKLVPQDPNDEPAEKLLERIRGQRAKKVAEKRVTVSRVKRRQNMDGN